MLHLPHIQRLPGLTSATWKSVNKVLIPCALEAGPPASAPSAPCYLPLPGFATWLITVNVLNDAGVSWQSLTSCMFATATCQLYFQQ